ncbi:MAG TPA: hypothetical protein EYH28_05895 [Anaerolineaceae bacterium]|nr:hypothetical protein [Anaerolineales bacterium]HIQ09027.1 hypothetical protein [Anaerolineaceae bacterium]
MRWRKAMLQTNLWLAFLFLAGAGILPACNFPIPTPLPLPTPFTFPTPNNPATGGGGEPVEGPVNSLTPTALTTPITATPLSATPDVVNNPPILYFTQAGDTLPVIAAHFGVSPEEIQSSQPLSAQGLLSPNLLLVIPRKLHNTTASIRLMPDSEVVYSPSAIGFDVAAFAASYPGYLNAHEEYLQSTGQTRGVDIVARIAQDNSINPRLLLALLEYQGHWLTQSAEELSPKARDYPLGYRDAQRKGLFRQLAWAVNQLSIGYYGWREGWLTEIVFADGVTARLAPDLNAGTVALQYFFAQLYPSTEWLRVMDPEQGFMALYRDLFGDPWARARQVEPLYPPDLTQPPLTLPFAPGQPWAFTGGPHGAWEHDGARAALDFAPTSATDCRVSYAWVLASAPGLVVRSAQGVVMLDLDGDGHEQTGWNLLYLHIADQGRVPVGTWVEAGDRLGHPSCEGGVATGTHIHFARKYNGEWIAADGPLPFVLSGWVAHAGVRPYQGTLTKDGQTVVASPYGVPKSLIVRGEDE